MMYIRYVQDINVVHSGEGIAAQGNDRGLQGKSAETFFICLKRLDGLQPRQVACDPQAVEPLGYGVGCLSGPSVEHRRHIEFLSVGDVQPVIVHHHQLSPFEVAIELRVVNSKQMSGGLGIKRFGAYPEALFVIG